MCVLLCVCVAFVCGSPVRCVMCACFAGGWPGNAWDFVVSNGGICSLADYPYANAGYYTDDKVIPAAFAVE